MSYKLASVIWNDDGTMANKELTPLEALKKIKKELHIIEIALKDYERRLKLAEEYEEVNFLNEKGEEK